MIKFNKDGYEIHVNTVVNPTYDWLILQEQLMAVISLIAASEEQTDMSYLYIFLQELLLSEEDAKKLELC